MQVKVVEWKKSPTRTRLGIVLVEFNQMVIKCELVIYIKNNIENPHLWIRMPEKWERGSKSSYCCWVSKSVSKVFQMLVLKQLSLKYGVDVISAQNIHKAFKNNNPKKN